MMVEENIHVREGSDLVVQGSQDLTISSQNVKSDIPKYWEKEHINTRLNEISNQMHKMLFFTLWRTGIRISEVINIKKADMDFENYMFTVRWLKSKKYKNRVVPMHPEFKEVIQLYCGSLKAEDLLFPISRQRAWQLCHKYLGGHPHQLRHSFAVNWLRCDGELIMLHRILGHSKIQTTMEYLKIVPIDQGKELIKINFR